MNNFFDNLEKSIKNSKDKKSEQQKIYNEVTEKHLSLKEKIFKNNLIDDFKNLEKIYQKNKDTDIDVRFLENGYILKISKKISYPENSSIEISLSLKGKNPSMFDDLKILEKFKISEDNFYLKVEELGDYEDWDDSPFGAMRKKISEKQFVIKEKEECYGYFNELFKKKILGLK